MACVIHDSDNMLGELYSYDIIAWDVCLPQQCSPNILHVDQFIDVIFH